MSSIGAAMGTAVGAWPCRAIARWPLSTLSSASAVVSETCPSRTAISVCRSSSFTRMSNSVPSKPAFANGVLKLSRRGSRLMTWMSPRSSSISVPSPEGGSGSTKMLCSATRNVLSSGSVTMARLAACVRTESPVQRRSPLVTAAHSRVSRRCTSTTPSTAVRSADHSSQLRAACAPAAGNRHAMASARRDGTCLVRCVEASRPLGSAAFSSGESAIDDLIVCALGPCKLGRARGLKGGRFLDAELTINRTAGGCQE